jgi:hypothetical protein
VIKWKWTNQVSNRRRGELKSAQTQGAEAYIKLELVIFRWREHELARLKGVSLRCEHSSKSEAYPNLTYYNIFTNLSSED